MKGRKIDYISSERPWADKNAHSVLIPFSARNFTFLKQKGKSVDRLKINRVPSDT